MTIIKAKRETIKSICEKYYENNINDLPYQGIVEIKNEFNTKYFESRIHLLKSLESKGNIGYAHETYVEIEPQLIKLIIDYITLKINDIMDDERLYDNYTNLLAFMKNLKFNAEEDILLYEHDC